MKRKQETCYPNGVKDRWSNGKGKSKLVFCFPVLNRESGTQKNVQRSHTTFILSHSLATPGE